MSQPTTDDDQAPCLTLSVSAAYCDACDERAVDLECPRCGKPLDAPTPTPGVRARQAALTSLAEQGRTIVQSFDALPDASVPVCADQFVAGVYGIRMSTRAADLRDVVTALSGFDCDDPATVGGDLRRALQRRIGDGQALADDCRLVALGDPGDSDLRDSAIAVGRTAVDVLVRYLDVLTAGDADACEQAQQDLDCARTGYVAACADWAEMAVAIDGAGASSTDERVGRVLATAGHYEGPYGALDPAAVFRSFADDAEPLARVADCAARYFTPLLDATVVDSSWATTLMLPAVTLALTEDPLDGYLCAQQTLELAGRAHAEDPDDTRRALEQMNAAGEIVLASAARIDRSLRSLSLSRELNDIAPLAAQTVMSCYLELCESVYRPLGWLVVNLRNIAHGQVASVGEPPPTVGQLRQMLLGGESDSLTARLASAVAPELRNMSAHAHYEWDAASEVVRDLQSGDEWDVELLDFAVSQMLGALAGTSAGCHCFLANHDISLGTPEWALRSPGRLAQVGASVMFEAYGLPVASVSADGTEIRLAENTEIDLARLLPPLGGIVGHQADSTVVSVYHEGASDPIVQIEAGTFHRVREASEERRSLAMIETMLDMEYQLPGHEPDAFRAFVARALKTVAVEGLQALAEPSRSGSTYDQLATALADTRAAILSRRPMDTDDERDAVARLERAKGASIAARAGSTKELKRLLSALRSLAMWADAQDVELEFGQL